MRRCCLSKAMARSGPGSQGCQGPHPLCPCLNPPLNRPQPTGLLAAVLILCGGPASPPPPPSPVCRALPGWRPTAFQNTPTQIWAQVDPPPGASRSQPPTPRGTHAAPAALFEGQVHNDSVRRLGRDLLRTSRWRWESMKPSSGPSEHGALRGCRGVPGAPILPHVLSTS